MSNLYDLWIYADDFDHSELYDHSLTIEQAKQLSGKLIKDGEYAKHELVILDAQKPDYSNVFMAQYSEIHKY